MTQSNPVLTAQQMNAQTQAILNAVNVVRNHDATMQHLVTHLQEFHETAKKLHTAIERLTEQLREKV